MTIIAVSCMGKDLNAKIDPRFGRAKGFLLIDSKTMKYEYIDNSEISEEQMGAGIKTTEKLLKKGIKIVLTGFVGPKVEKILEDAKVKIICGLDGLTVKEALEKEEKQIK